MGLIDKIKALFKLKGLASWFLENYRKEVKVDNQVKPSWKTGEFWFAVGSQLVPFILYMWQYIPESAMVKMMAICGTLAVVIVISRTIVKATPTKRDDEVYNRVITVLQPILDKLNVKAEKI